MNDMNAKEAREKATSVTEGINANQYKDVKKKIEEAVYRGQLSCNYYDSLNNAVIEKLRSEGYKVDSYYDQRDGSTISISW